MGPGGGGTIENVGSTAEVEAATRGRHEALRPPIIHDDRAARDARSLDFGRMERHEPAAVAKPMRPEEVAEVIAEARRQGRRLVVRGGGHSQGGQSLAPGGIALDLSGLDRVGPREDRILPCQAGAMWGQVLEALDGVGLAPPVLPDTDTVTVGGFLSAGGFGMTSHRYGPMVQHVEQLEVATASGALVRCSRSDGADLFDAVRGGQGQFGIITQIWLRLEPLSRRIRMYDLGYRDPMRFLRDLDEVDLERFELQRTQVRVREGRIVLRIGVGYDSELSEGAALDGLRHDEIRARAEHPDPLRAGFFPPGLFARQHYRPWRDWLTPWEALPKLLTAEALFPEPEHRPRDAWMYVCRALDDSCPMFRLPSGERFVGFSVLTGHASRHLAREMAERLHRLDRTMVALGAKTYLSGRTGYDEDQWRAHYGPQFEIAAGWKQRFDPDGILGAPHLPFGSERRPPGRHRPVGRNSP